jgi:four helix bundle protein
MAQVVLITPVMAGARRYQDLICWQLADELEKLVFELTETGPASRDFKFRDQIRDSSSSVTRNMAEGFGRFFPAEHANFLRIAKASLMETHNSAGAGFSRGYFGATDTDRMQRLCGRSGKAATGLIRYLESQIPSTKRRRPRRRRRTSGT